MNSDTPIISDLPVGLRLCDRYVIKEKIADGAMASVYLATDETATMDVALKILDPLRGADPVGHARFEREFQVLSRLEHPSIARCFRMERDGDLDILVMEHVHGSTLESRILEGGRMKVKEAATIALSLAEALEACHAQGILHRDLKPANVVLEPARGPVILDFGVAWFSSAANLTRTGAVIGSPQYLAPEAFSSSLVDARADIYALGAILFEMLTGRPVRLVSSVAEMAGENLLQEPPAPSTVRPGISASLDAVVLRALAPRPEERFATAAALAAALRDGRLSAKARLQERLPCHACRSPLILDLPFCPGCGTGVAWKLLPGPYAVQLNEVRDVDGCMKWLLRRHGESLATRRTMVARRLPHTPVPLVVGASFESAEQLVAEAREAGCKAEIVRARAIIGAKLQPAAATPGEMVAAAALHFLATSLLGVLFVLMGEAWAPAGMPGIVAAVGILVAWWYVRRPLLRCSVEDKDASQQSMLDVVRKKLKGLTTDRARKLAAGAVARAAPALEDTAAQRQQPVVDSLLKALDSIAQLDAHAAFLMGRSRSRLAAEIADASARAERHDPTAIEDLARLEQERKELTEVALAHDLAARNVLEATEAISAA